MNKLKNTIALLILIGALAYSGFYFYRFSLDPCRKPIEYGIGRLDFQFGVSRDNFLSYAEEAGGVWEKASGKEIFIYNPEAKFKVNLIYDERQIATVQKQKTEYGLSVAEEAFKSIDVSFDALKSRYDGRVLEYERALSLFNQRKSVYDKEVASWNKKGGAPKEKFEELEAERQYLNAEVDRLNRESSEIQKLASQVNSLLEQRNAKAAEYNRIAEGYNEKFEGGLEFNQAEYIGNPNDSRTGQINVYQFGGRKDLVLALAHEFGHALDMGHVENPKSIMYYLTGINADTSLVPSPEDLAELERVCEI